MILDELDHYVFVSYDPSASPNIVERSRHRDHITARQLLTVRVSVGCQSGRIGEVGEWRGGAVTPECGRIAAVAVTEISERRRPKGVGSLPGERPRPGEIWSDRGCQPMPEGHQLGGPRLMHEEEHRVHPFPEGIRGTQEPDISHECRLDPRGSPCACPILRTLTVIVRADGCSAGPRGRMAEPVGEPEPCEAIECNRANPAGWEIAGLAPGGRRWGRIRGQAECRANPQGRGCGIVAGRENAGLTPVGRASRKERV